MSFDQLIHVANFIGAWSLLFIPIAILLGGLAYLANKSMWLVGGVFTIIVGLAIGGVAAYFSIVGLMALFAGAAQSVAIMGGVLETGKFILAAVMHYFWKKLGWGLRMIMVAQMVVLMAITSIGIFGYLSQAHLKHGEKTELSDNRIAKLEAQIASKQREIASNDKQVETLRAGIFGIMSQGFVKAGGQAKAKFDSDITAIQKKNDAIRQEIEQIEAEKVNITGQRNAINREIGPLKYVAELIWDEGNQVAIDKAVRMMVLIIMFVFDPFAVIMFLVGTMLMQQGMVSHKFRRARERHQVKRGSHISRVKKARPQMSSKPPVAANFDAPQNLKAAAKKKLTPAETNDINVATTTDGKSWGQTRLSVLKGGGRTGGSQ